MFHRGNVTLSGLLAVFFVFTFFMIIVYQGQMSVMKIKKRAYIHLCLRYYMARTYRYMEKVNDINKMISVGYSLSLLPGGEMAKKSVTFFRWMQTAYHFVYVKEIMAYRFCSLKQKLYYLKNLPYQMKTRFQFKRSGMKTTIIRRKKWEMNIIQEGIFLKILWNVKSVFDTHPKLSVREIMSWH